jgi:hypothetical protein
MNIFTYKLKQLQLSLFMKKLLQLLLGVLVYVNLAFSQNLPELMYFKFNALANGKTANEAPIATRAGVDSAVVTGLTIGGTGQFGTALNGAAGATATNNVNPAWSGTQTGSWTISFWCNPPTPPTTRYYFGNSTGNGTFRCFIGGVAVGIRLAGGVPAVALDMPAFTPGPNVVTYVYDQPLGTVSAYLNGVFQTSASPGSSFPLVGANFFVGSQGTSIEGPMDEFRMYNRALSATEIASTWNITLLSSKPYNNASVQSLVAPLSICGTSFHDIKVKVKNTGNNILTNVNVQWSLDGIMQSVIPITSPLDTVGGTLYSNDTIITLGNVSFGSIPRSVIAWTEYPNSVIDTTNYDDTLRTMLASSLSGSYTIGGVSADYPTMADAVSALNSYGVCGPVTFNVDSASGPYTSDLKLLNVQGSSAINTIRFNGNGSVITSANSPVLGISGSSYITMDRFTIMNTGATGFGVHVGGGSHHLTFTHNTINVGTTATAATSGGFIASGSSVAATTLGNSVQYLTFTDNEVIGGYYNFTLIGNTGIADNYGHLIANNTFRDFYMYGVYLSNADSTIIRGNNIHRANRASVTTFYGIYNTASRYLTIQKNRIHDAGGTGAAYPFYITNCVNSIGYETEISNNAIYNLNNGTTMYGFYCLTTATTGVNFYHNTIQHNVVSGTGVIRGAYFSVALTNVNFKNNIISITGGGTGIKTGIYVATASASFNSNNNDIYVNTSASNNIGYWGAVASTLTDWRTASSQDMASVSSDPLFLNLSNGELQPTAVGVKGIGVPLGIQYDLVGNLRSSVNPDPGAFESLKSYNDAGVQASTSLLSCATLQDVKVKLVNYGKNAITNVTVNWSVNGIPQIPVLFSSTIDTIGSALGNDTTIVIGQISPSVGVNDTIIAWTSSPNSVADTTTYNDSVLFVMKSGFAAGTYTVGSGGNYTTLTAALTAMANGVCGPVVLELQGNYSSVGETFPLVFPKGSGASNTIVVRPQIGATALTISGADATTLIDFNNSQYASIDGRPGGLGTAIELSIVNTSTSGATIRFINGSSYNALKYVTVTGNNATAASGVVFFTTSNTAVGNSYNLIDHSNINGNSASVNCIYSSGSSLPAENIANTITNNNIYDFFSNAGSLDISGVALVAGSSNWIIGSTGNGNNFYQTAARTTTSTPALTALGAFKAVYINNATIGGCSIVGNRIGGNIPGIPASTFVIGDAATNVGHTIRLIDNYVSNPIVANVIQGNIISDITTNSTVSNAFIGIHGRSGMVDIIGNTIGSQTGTGNITIYFNGTTTGANTYAIRYEAGAGVISNNIIGGMSAEVRNATGGLQLLCVYYSGALLGPLTVSNNIIGGTAQHSIQSTSTSLGNVNVMGLCASGASGALLTVSNNLIRNLSSLNTTAGTNNGLKGIYNTGVSSVGTFVSNNTVMSLYSASTNVGVDQTSAVIGITCINSSGNHILSQNKVYDLRSAAPTAAINAFGILVNGATTGSILVEKNKVYAITTSAGNTAATIAGIYLGAAVTSKVNVWNNMVSLGSDSAGTSFSEAVSMSGILKNGAKASIIYNTVKIEGSGVGSTVNNSFAFNTLSNSVGDSVVNNVFVNSRLNSGSGGNHYAIGLPNSTNVFSNYNLFTVASPFIGLYNGVAQTNLPAWQTATSMDANSVSSAVNFVSFSDLHVAGASVGDLTLKGVNLTYITTDIDNAIRTVTPYMGADEGAIPLPVKLTSFNAKLVKEDVQLNWTTAFEENTAYFKLMASKDGKQFEEIGKMQALGRSNKGVNYAFVHKQASIWSNQSPSIYYQLVSVDRDGHSMKSAIVTVSFTNQGNFSQTSVYPNPFNTEVTLSVPTSIDGIVDVTVTDITGKVMVTKQYIVTKGTNMLTLDGLQTLAKGLYTLSLTNATETTTLKLVKE